MHQAHILHLLNTYMKLCKLWFKFFFGLKFFKPVWFLFYIILYLDYHNQEQREKKSNLFEKF